MTGATVLPFGYVAQRPCLICRQLFRSAGAHNRVCTPCKYRDNPNDWD